MSASDGNTPEGASRPPEPSDVTPSDDASPRTLRSPLPPPPRMPSIVPMPELSQASAPAASPLAPQGEGPGVRTPIAAYGQQVERGAWQRRDKVEPNDPTDDEELISVEGGGWAIIGASRIGRGHLHDGKYREDGLAAAITSDGWQLVAVADGGGSYRLARVGAPLAAREAVAAMRAALGETVNAEGAEFRGGRGEGQRFTTEATEATEARAEGGTAEVAEVAEVPEVAEEVIEARAALVAGLRAARRALYDEAARRRAAGDEAATMADLRTTLLLALHRTLPDGRQLVAGAQIGDGLIAAREGAEGTLHLLGAPETGAIGNETMFLPDVPDEAGEWEGRVRVAWLDGAGVYLLALTDGVSDDFAPASEHLWRLERPLLASALAPRHTAAEAAAALRDLLGYERAGSFDDRTLVCVYHRSPTP